MRESICRIEALMREIEEELDSLVDSVIDQDGVDGIDSLDGIDDVEESMNLDTNNVQGG